MPTPSPGTPGTTGTTGTTGTPGRDSRGRFGTGNPGGPGNPHAKRTAQLRAALLKAVKPRDIANIVAALIDQARKGNVSAIREVLDRTIGPAALASDLVERIEELERTARELDEAGGRHPPAENQAR